MAPITLRCVLKHSIIFSTLLFSQAYAKVPPSEKKSSKTSEGGKPAKTSKAGPSHTAGPLEPSIDASHPIDGPVIETDFADPSVIRINDTYWAYASSNDQMHLPVASSQDFHEWTVETADGFPELPDWCLTEGGASITSPEMNHKEDSWLLYFTCAVKEASSAGKTCIGVATSEKAAGPFKCEGSGPLICPEGGATDPNGWHDFGGKSKSPPKPEPQIKSKTSGKEAKTKTHKQQPTKRSKIEEDNEELEKRAMSKSQSEKQRPTQTPKPKGGKNGEEDETSQRYIIYVSNPDAPAPKEKRSGGGSSTSSVAAPGGQSTVVAQPIDHSGIKLAQSSSVPTTGSEHELENQDGKPFNLFTGSDISSPSLIKIHDSQYLILYSTTEGITTASAKDLKGPWQKADNPVITPADLKNASSNSNPQRKRATEQPIIESVGSPDVMAHADRRPTKDGGERFSLVFHALSSTQASPKGEKQMWVAALEVNAKGEVSLLGAETGGSYGGGGGKSLHLKGSKGEEDDFLSRVQTADHLEGHEGLGEGKGKTTMETKTRKSEETGRAGGRMGE